MESSTQVEALHSAVVPILVQSSDREDRTEQLVFEVQMSFKNSQSSKKALSIRVTDDKDPLFLYTMDIYEEDFSRLRSEQNLRVDFATFPTKVIAMAKNVVSTAQSKQPFLAVLDTNINSQGFASFRFVETNEFKHLTHLELFFCPGSDTTLKTYLASRLNELKAERASLQSRLADTESTLTARLTTAENELADLRLSEKSHARDHASAMEEARLGHAREVQALREAHTEAQNTLQQDLRQEYANDLKKRGETITELSSKLDKVSAAYKEATDKNFTLETQVRELQHKVETYEKDLQHFENEIVRLRTDNQNLDMTKFEQDKAVNGHLIRISALEQEVKDKTEMISQMTHAVETADEQKREHEETIAFYKQTIQKLEAKCNATVEEIHKGNNIIQKLQGDLKTIKGKMKIKNSVLQQQEDHINDLQAELDEKNHMYRDIVKDCDHKDTEISKLKSSLQETTKKLTDLGETLKSNDQVIRYLNNQITEAHLTGQRAPNTAVKSAISNYNFRPSFYATGNRTLDDSSAGRAVNGAGVSGISVMQTPQPNLDFGSSIKPTPVSHVVGNGTASHASVAHTSAGPAVTIMPPLSSAKTNPNHVQYRPFGSVRENENNISNNNSAAQTPVVSKPDALSSKYLSASPQAATENEGSAQAPPVAV